MGLLLVDSSPFVGFEDWFVFVFGGGGKDGDGGKDC